MKKLILFIGIIFISLNALAVNENFSDLKALMNSYFNENGSLNAKGQLQVTYANSYASQIPEVIASIFGNETINIELTFDDKSKEIIGIKTKNAKIIEAKKTSYSNATMNVFVSEKSIKKILSNENRIKGFIDAYTKGEINYKAKGIIPEVKKGIVDTIISILRFFNFFGTGQFLLPYS